MEILDDCPEDDIWHLKGSANVICCRLHCGGEHKRPAAGRAATLPGERPASGLFLTKTTLHDRSHTRAAQIRSVQRLFQLIIRQLMRPPMNQAKGWRTPHIYVIKLIRKSGSLLKLLPNILESVAANGNKHTVREYSDSMLLPHCFGYDASELPSFRKDALLTAGMTKR